MQLDTTLTMTYDAFGRWVEQNVSGSGYRQAVYAPDGSKTLLMAGSNVVTAYVYLPQGAIASYSGNTLYVYWHPDWLGTPRLYSTTSRTVDADVEIAPYGTQYPTSPWVDTFFGGAGQIVEANDLRTYPARNLSIWEGRWLTPDPAGLAAVDLTNPQSLNRYAYVVGNPLGLVDPSGMTSLVYDGSTNTLTVFPSYSLADPTQTVEADPGMRFCAANNIVKGLSIGQMVDGTYSFLDTTQPHHHSKAEDSTDGPFGPGGIFRLKEFIGADGIMHTGVGIHAGRKSKGGYTHVTNGCIRTTEDAVGYITYLVQYDPLTSLRVINNRAPAKPVNGKGGASAASTINYDWPGLSWGSIDMIFGPAYNPDPPPITVRFLPVQ